MTRSSPQVTAEARWRAAARHVVPDWLWSYRRGWVTADVLAGVTLAAVAIPECMGYTSIAQTPIVTGLYTILLPTLVFALLGSSRILVVGADSATAALLAAGLTALSVPGLTPYSQEWVAWSSLVALVCGAMLLAARLLRLGFLGDFLSASVLIGFLTGVGVSVLTGQLPEMLGISKGSGRWLHQQWYTLTHLGDTDLHTLAYAVATLAIILGCRRFAPKVPGAVLAVVLSIVVSWALDSGSHGVSTVGSVRGGLPPIGLPSTLGWHNVTLVLGLAASCFVLIIAQSAATSRSFAMRHDQRVDIDRDLLGLAGAELAASVTGTFVVNGSPTKTQILDEQHGRTQVANITMSLLTLVVVLWLSSLLADLPHAVLGGIVFVVALDLIDVAGARRLLRHRRSEFVIALATAAVVVLAGVQAGIVMAVVLSILELVRRQYHPRNFVIGVQRDGHPTYLPATPGAQSAPGLLVFRYDAELFYANASRFVDAIQELILSTPDPVRWLVLDCSSIDDIDYSAGQVLGGLITGLHRDDRVFGIAGADPALVETLRGYDVLREFDNAHLFATVADAVQAFLAENAPPAGAANT